MPRGAGKNLNATQIKFCQFYVQTGNLAESSRRAGWNVSSYGWTLLKNRKILDYIKEYRELHARVAKIDATWLINSTAQTIDDNNPRDRVKAKDLMARLLGSDPVINRTLDLKEKAIELERLKLENLKNAINQGLLPVSEIIYSVLSKDQFAPTDERSTGTEL